MRNRLDSQISLIVLLTLLLTLVLASASPAQIFPIRPVFSCTPVKVSTYKSSEGGRVWVQCEPPLNNAIKFFAVPLTDAAEAARFLSLFTAAHVTGKIIDIEYDSVDTTSGPQYNCKSTECRPALSATIR